MIRQTHNRASGDGGFTIVEVLIALQLSLMIASMTYVAYRFSSRLIGNYERKLAVERELSQVSRSLSRAISQVRSVQKLAPREFSAMRSDGRPLRIRLEEQVFLNGERLGGGLLTLHGGSISGLSAEGGMLPSIPYPNEKSPVGLRGVSLALIFRDGEILYPLNLTIRLVRRGAAIMIPTRQPPRQ